MSENRFKLRAKANGSWTLGSDHNRRITQRFPCLLFTFTHPQDDDVYEQRVVKERLTLCDILRKYPDLSLPAVMLLSNTPPLKPRYYSISSSPLQSPGEVHITAAVVKYSTKLSTGENDDDLELTRFMDLHFIHVYLTMPESLTLALALALDCGSQTNSCYLIKSN